MTPMYDIAVRAKHDAFHMHTHCSTPVDSACQAKASSTQAALRPLLQFRVFKQTIPLSAREKQSIADIMQKNGAKPLGTLQCSEEEI